MKEEEVTSHNETRGSVVLRLLKLCSIMRQEIVMLHFLLWYSGYDKIRKKSILLQSPYIENKENIIRQLLFNELKIQETKEILYEMWKKKVSERT